MKKITRSGAAALTALTMIAASSGGVLAAQADPGDAQFSIELEEEDGIAEFNEDDTAGHDSGPSNGIVRTNDVMHYTLEVRTSDPVDNTTITMEFPAGLYIENLPGFCLNGSSLSARGVPVQPYDETTYLDLGVQTMICNVGTRMPGSTVDYNFDTKVSGWVPNGVTLQPTGAVTGDGAEQSDIVFSEVTVSAKALGDVSKNGDAIDPDSGYVYKTGSACSFDPSRACRGMSFNLMTFVPKDGIGASPITSVRLKEDLTPENFYPSGVTSLPAWADAEANYPGGALAKYGARLSICSFSNGMPNSAGYRIGSSSNATAVNSVIDSGEFTATGCGDGSPGAIQNIEITEINGSAETCPTQAIRGGSLRTDTCAISTPYLKIEIPNDAVKDLGGETDSDTGSLKLRNTITDIEMIGLDGTPISNEWEDPSNNYRTTEVSVGNGGSISKRWAGLVDDPNSTPPSVYGSSLYGPPGNYRSSNRSIPVMSGQKVIGILSASTSGGSGDVNNSIVCDAWDNSKLYLAGGPYAAATDASGQRVGTTDPKQAAWISYFNRVNDLTGSLEDMYTVQYAYDPNGSGPGDDSVCGQGLDWKDDPEDVVGNDPAKLAENVFTGPNRVRFHYSLPAVTDNRSVVHSIGFEVSEDLTEIGTIVPNWGSETRLYTEPGNEATLEEIYENGKISKSSYNMETARGGIGNRLLLSKAYAKIDKKIRKAGDTEWVDAVSSTGGGNLEFRLEPSFLSSVSAGAAYPVMVEDCLSPAAVFTEASRAPTLAVTVGADMPEGSNISCDPGDLYLRWDLGDIVPREVIEPITFTAKIKRTVNSGTYNAHTEISSPVDATGSELRTSDVSFSVQQPAGIVIEKSALTPVTPVNKADAPNKSLNSWLIEMASIQATAVDARVIDILPKNGVNGSDFSGTSKLVGVTQKYDTENKDIEVFYTSNVDVNRDPAHISNDQLAGTTVWCDSIDAGGVVVYPTTMAGDACGGDEVTAILMERDGNFESGNAFAMQIDMELSGNVNDDTYNNSASASADGLMTIGPVSAIEKVIEGKIGNLVWNDANGNGIQDEGEDPIPGVQVNLVGTDDLGNTVSETTITDEDGIYEFNILRGSEYTLTFIRPEGFDGFTIKGAGTDATVNSVVDANGSVTVELAHGETLSDVDAGLVPTPPTASIGDYVWLDTNGNGIQDEGEEGVAGVSVGITWSDSDGNSFSDSTVTDSSGKYLFSGMSANKYTLKFTLPSGYEGFTSYLSGASTAKDSDVNSYGIATVTLASGVDNMTIDAGLLPKKADPTPTPTPTPTESPTPTPTDDPTGEPTPTPTDEPTGEPTPTPTDSPSEDPTPTPTSVPTPTPTDNPVGENTGTSTESLSPVPTQNVVILPNEVVTITGSDKAVAQKTGETGGSRVVADINSGEVNSKTSLTSILLGMLLMMTGGVVFSRRGVSIIK